MTLPLTGIKVVDFSEHGFVPSAAAVLADWGADVVKIERPRGDAMRGIIASGIVETVDGYDYLFELVNRNKRGIALDVEAPAGRAAFERLVRWADVYITNQLPRVRRKLCTEPSDLLRINPRLVYAKGHGQGQRGPDAEAGGFDSVSFWSRGGVAHVLSDPEASQPAQQRPAIGDVPTGMFLAGGICAAVVHAMRTGTGIVVDTSLLNGAAWTLGPDLAYSSLSGQQLDTQRPRPPLMRQYKTSDGRFVTLTMIDEARYWAPACRALGLEELIAEYPDPEPRRAAWGPLRDRIAGVVRTLTRDELDARLRAEGCIYSFLASPPEVLHDPAVVENGYLMTHPTEPQVRLAAAPAQFDDELPRIRRPGPALGEHSREILTELGYAEDEIADLVTDGVLVAPLHKES
jgi:crotonobetainyl-CoA:carnitine CoA-transferase CaiB-like acyl-CoA transferase